MHTQETIRELTDAELDETSGGAPRGENYTRDEFTSHMLYAMLGALTARAD